MTLREALQINHRINILPYHLTCQIRDLEVDVIQSIVHDPCNELLYCKIELFEYQIELKKIGDIKPGDLRMITAAAGRNRRHKSIRSQPARNALMKNRRQNSLHMQTKVIPDSSSPTK